MSFHRKLERPPPLSILNWTEYSWLATSLYAPLGSGAQRDVPLASESLFILLHEQRPQQAHGRTRPRHAPTRITAHDAYRSAHEFISNGWIGTKDDSGTVNVKHTDKHAIPRQGLSCGGESRRHDSAGHVHHQACLSPCSTCGWAAGIGDATTSSSERAMPFICGL
jgi:hypothetical protein